MVMSSGDENVDVVSVHLPPFFKNSPMAWSAVIEAQFNIKGIKDNVMKYYHAVAKLDFETCERIQACLQ